MNSGTPNKAFFLAATSIGGYAWEKIERIRLGRLIGWETRVSGHVLNFDAPPVRNTGLTRNGSR